MTKLYDIKAQRLLLVVIQNNSLLLPNAISAIYYAESSDQVLEKTLKIFMHGSSLE
jgi:hypothetical protein